MSLLLHKRSVNTPFSEEKGRFFSLSFLLPRAVAVHTPHEAKPFHITLFLFVCVVLPACSSLLCSSMNDWPSLYVCVYMAEMCASCFVWKCFLRVGGLWYASLVGGFHQQKSIPLYSAATIQQLVWGLGPASCFTHLHAAWTQSADAHWELRPSICIVFTPLHEANQFAAVVRLDF